VSLQLKGNFVVQPQRVDHICHSPIEQLIFSEQTILDRLNKLKITKSPGPNGIHPRILYEL